MEALRGISKTYGAYNVPAFQVLNAATARPFDLTGMFIRPCPTVPRHGFVDSRLISSDEEATAIISETLKADPNAEFIRMNKIGADYSAIWTPGVLVIGPSNDGATAGKQSVSIPIQGNMFYNHSSEFLKDYAGIKSAPYVELLWPCVDNYWKLVQLRDGPPIPQQVDYVPADTKVEHVVVAEGDLLEWETKMQNQPAGTVVYHPGGSLASHYAVHAAVNKIPVLVSREPKIGERLFADTANPVLEPNLEDIKTGFAWALTAQAEPSTALHMMIVGCHSTAMWMGRCDVLLGAALGFTYRLAVTAGIGEWRHRTHGRFLKYQHGRRVIPSREGVYDHVWGKTHKVRRVYRQSLYDFRVRDWNTSMGGENWYQFTHWAALLLNAILSDDLKTALECMNKTVNAVHNGGWGFNKFGDKLTMDRAASNPITAVSLAGPLMYQAMTLTSDDRMSAKKVIDTLKPIDISDADNWMRDALKTKLTPVICWYRLDGTKLIVKISSNKNCRTNYVTVEKELPADRALLISKEIGRLKDARGCLYRIIVDDPYMWALGVGPWPVRSHEGTALIDREDIQ